MQTLSLSTNAGLNWVKISDQNVSSKVPKIFLSDKTNSSKIKDKNIFKEKSIKFRKFYDRHRRHWQEISAWYFELLISVSREENFCYFGTELSINVNSLNSFNGKFVISLRILLELNFFWLDYFEWIQNIFARFSNHIWPIFKRFVIYFYNWNSSQEEKEISVNNLKTNSTTFPTNKN